MSERDKKWEKGFNIFCGILAILMLGVTLYLTAVEDSSIPKEAENKYRRAQQLEEMGDYWNAYNLYLELGEYNNSNIKAEIIYPKAAMNYGTMLFYSDTPLNSIPYLLDASRNGIAEADELLMKLVQDYLARK